MVRRIAEALSVLTVAVLLAGCQRDAPADRVAAGPATGGKITIAVIPKGTSQSFWLSVKAGAEDAARAEGATVVWDGPTDESDVQGQIRILKSAATRKVDAVVMAACDAKGLVPHVNEVIAQGIPVVTIDSGLDPDVSAALLATDNVRGGEEAAKALASEIGGKGKVGLIIFSKGAASSNQREEGFLKGIAPTPAMDLGNRTHDCNCDVAEALRKTKALLTSTPDLAGIFAANQSGAEGAIQAIRQMNLGGKVKLVCFDGSDAEIQALKDGIAQVLIVQNPFRMGSDGVRVAMRLIRKEPVTEKRIDTGVTVIRKEDLAKPEIQKLLQPLK